MLQACRLTRADLTPSKRGAALDNEQCRLSRLSAATIKWQMNGASTFLQYLQLLPAYWEFWLWLVGS